MNKGKSIVFILLAIVIALLGTYFVSSFLVGQRESYEKKMAQMTKATVEEGDVVYTKMDISQQAQLTPDMVEIRKIAKNYIPADALTSLDQVKSQFARVPLVKDEPVRLSKLVNKSGATGLPYRIPEGKRAVTVSMTESKAVAYAINPGDRVDVMGIFTPAADKAEEGPRCVTILQAVEVLDITASNVENAPNTRTATPTATLAVDPKDAEKLALVESRATLVLMLRGANDDKSLDSDGITLAEAMGKPRASIPAQMPSPNGPAIQIYSGNSMQQYQVPK